MTPNVYNPERMLEVFGTTDPDIAQRSDHFTALWEQWRGSVVRLDTSKVLDKQDTVRYNSIIRVMSEAGYDHWFDYQKRSNMVRFATPEVRAVFMLYYGDLTK